MSHNDLGLTTDSYQQLTASRKRTAVRLKVLKAIGTKGPDQDTTNTLNIYNWNNEALYSSDPTTGDDNYGKMVHDTKHNRTFILHSSTQSRKNTDSNYIVSIINHDVDTDDEKFIERVDTVPSPSWPDGYARTIYDMAYDPDNQRLALAVSGSSLDPQAPGLLVIDMNKYLDNLENNVCNVLEENPDYLSAEFWTYSASGADAYLDATTSAIHKFVVYYDNRFFALNYFSTGTGSSCWQLCCYSGQYECSILRAFGVPPDKYDNNSLDNSFHPDVQRPFAFPTAATGFYARGDGYLGDPFSPGYGTTITNFNLNSEEGLLCIGFTPSSSHSIYSGIEAFAIVFDLSKHDQPLTPLLNGANLYSGVAYYDETETLYKLDQEIVQKTFDVSGSTGILYVKAYTVANTHPSYNFSSDHLYTETDYGTTREPGVRSTDNAPHLAEWYSSVIQGPSESMKVGYSFQGALDDEPFAISVATEIYADPMVVTVFRQDELPGWYMSGDTTRPNTVPWTDAFSNTWQMAEYVNMSGETYLTIDHCTAAAIEWAADSYSLLANMKYSSTYLGLWIARSFDDSDLNTVTQLSDSNSDLLGNNVAGIHVRGSTALLFSHNTPGSATTSAVQLVDFSDATPVFSTVYTPDMTIKSKGYTGRGMFYDRDRRLLGILFGSTSASETQFWWPDVEEGVWSRNPRVWWDGSDPDAVIGDETLDADSMSQKARIRNVSFSQGKGVTSYLLSFSVSGAEYLPWALSPFNENPDFPGSYDGTLQDGSRLVLERGVWDGRQWTWIAEGQFFVQDLPVDISSGYIDMRVTAGGPISMLVTRAVYNGYHEPDFTDYSSVSLNEGDDYVYSYESGGETITNWRLDPPAEIKVGGEAATGYTLDSAAGTVTFEQDPGGDVTANFMAWVDGTNEAEDLILCILTYPNHLGGPGLDLSYITRTITSEELTGDGEGNYSFSKNMVISDHAYTRIYDDSGDMEPGSDYTWNDGVSVVGETVSRSGSVNVTGSISGTLKGDCVHFTVQKSGVTVKPLNLNVRTQSSAYTCLNEVLRRVAPNYILTEARDGKIECDYHTQKPAGEEDIVIEDDEIIIRSLADNPVYEDIATRVISLGDANLLELPNYCLGKTVTDELTGKIQNSTGYATAWINSDALAYVTDGDPATGASGGWGHENWPAIPTDEGYPMITIDMEEPREVHTIIVARPGGPATELPDHVQVMSISASLEGDEWTRIVNPFELRCGANTRETAGDTGMWPEGYIFQYIRIYIHAYSLYPGPRNNDSLFSISEVQAYGNSIIEGVAELQDTDSTQPLYDTHGLLRKYGFLTKLARGGTPDETLRTKAACDLDARYVLEELVRLMRQEQIDAPWLPGIPIYSTIKVTNRLLGQTRTFFVENRSFNSGSGDTYSGATYDD